ncbi:Putative sensor-like histidine kinase (plasmid) [Euzebya pacifica]|uniref:histidine kinase n=1 Tax=Euzebya pacifica TaxID=1608957 RepID=A0A346Y6N2_9ACTN|nr:nitrate- and nitrite sensing domain-containing protein [Euzebya pacifica]AXV10129.1 Putative sensor-like histidine kinase [Euzebya pacifica]
MNLSIRTRLLALLITPAMGLVAVAGFQVVGAGALQAEADTTIEILVSAQAADRLIAAIQQESLLSVASLNPDADVAIADVAQARSATDSAAADLLATVTSEAGSLAGQAAVDTAVPGLAQTRAVLDSGSGTGREFTTAERYSALTHDLIARIDAAGNVIEDAGISSAMAALSALVKLRQAVTDQSMSVLVALDSGTARDTLLIRTVGTSAERQVWLNEFSTAAPGLADDATAAVQPLTDFDGVGPADGLDVTAADLLPSLIGVGDTLAGQSITINAVLGDLADAINAEAQNRFLIAVALAGAAALLVLLVPMILNRTVIRPLAKLTGFAEYVRNRLPSAVAEAAQGDQVGRVADDLDPVLRDRRDEIGVLATAVVDSSQEALDVAVGQARVREGTNATVTNMALRTKDGVDLALEQLERMQRDEADPKRLERLYELDQAIVQLRRHAESMLTLTGEGRIADPDEDPIRVYDLIRSAASETKDFRRVEVSNPGRGLQAAGYVVPALSQLLSNLIDNALRFSPPDQIVHAGVIDNPDSTVTVSIRDHGIGMDDEAMSTAMQRIIDPPLLDAAESQQLGLYVVGLIARELGVDVSLSRPSDGYGGVEANVRIPSSLLIDPQTGFALPSPIMQAPVDADDNPAQAPVPVAEDDSDKSMVEATRRTFASWFKGNDSEKRRRGTRAAHGADEQAGDTVVGHTFPNRVLPAAPYGPAVPPAAAGTHTEPAGPAVAAQGAPAATEEPPANDNRSVGWALRRRRSVISPDGWSTPFPGPAEPNGPLRHPMVSQAAPTSPADQLGIPDAPTPAARDAAANTGWTDTPRSNGAAPHLRVVENPPAGPPTAPAEPPSAAQTGWGSQPPPAPPPIPVSLPRRIVDHQQPTAAHAPLTAHPEPVASALGMPVISAPTEGVDGPTAVLPSRGTDTQTPAPPPTPSSPATVLPIRTSKAHKPQPAAAFGGLFSAMSDDEPDPDALSAMFESIQGTDT